MINFKNTFSHYYKFEWKNPEPDLFIEYLRSKNYIKQKEIIDYKLNNEHKIIKI